VLSTQHVAKKTGGAGACAPGPVGFSALPAVAAAALNGQTSVVLALRADNEGSNSGWKRFGQGASLTVSYNSIPGKPAPALYTTPSRSCSTVSSAPTSLDPTEAIGLRVTASDADSGQSLTTAFVVEGVGSTTFSTTYTSPPSAAGPVDALIPAGTLSIGDYRWSAKTNDGVGGIGVSSDWCYFRTVNVNPALPTVTQTSTASTVVGEPMTVEFGSAAADGVSIFAYWWVVGSSSVPPSPPVLTAITPGQPLPACGSASGSVRFACPATGSLSSTPITVAPVDALSTLWVASYNDAGRVSLANGVYSATPLHVTSGRDTTGVGLANGHIWDSTWLPSSATTVPDLNTVSGSSGTTTRQDLAPASTLGDSELLTMPTTVHVFGASTPALITSRPALDVSQSYTISAWLRPSATQSAGAHTALSQTIDGAGSAFILGTNAAGQASFCVQPAAGNSAPVCANGSVLPLDEWTMITGVWDAANANLRVLVNSTITPVGIASLGGGAVATAGPWSCIGAKCSYSEGVGAQTERWEGQILRPAMFPGVISGAQLYNLWALLSPNDDPPADESIGSVVTLACGQMLTPQDVYDFNPTLSGPLGWTPTSGSEADRAQGWNGLACRWVYESSGIPVDVSVARIVDFGTMSTLLTSARTGTSVAGLGDEAYFAGTTLQVFQDGYWLAIRDPWSSSGWDNGSLALVALAALP